jgi:ATP-dependent RNA helicase DeaD
MLKTIERVTKRRVAVQKLPTVGDLRARRLDLTRAALRESILEDDLDGFRVVVESLADEFDVLEVAMAAVKLAHDSGGGSDSDYEDIPDASVRADSAGATRQGGTKRGATTRGAATRLYISVGRDAGVRPQDLVGAITGETHLTGKDLGSIEITQRFSLVEVPESEADEVVQAMRGVKIRGSKATVRRERF